jgi:hypothetical protein
MCLKVTQVMLSSALGSPPNTIGLIYHFIFPSKRSSLRSFRQTEAQRTKNSSTVGEQRAKQSGETVVAVDCSHLRNVPSQTFAKLRVSVGETSP